MRKSARAKLTRACAEYVRRAKAYQSKAIGSRASIWSASHPPL